MHRLIVNIGRNGFKVSMGHAIGFLLVANEVLHMRLEGI